MTLPTVLNLGGGIQSSYMLLKACRNEMPRPSHVVFADTGWEPPSVMAQIQWLIEEAAKHGIRVDTVRYKIDIKENLRIAAAGGHFDTLPMYTSPKVTAWEDAADAATFMSETKKPVKGGPFTPILYRDFQGAADYEVYPSHGARFTAASKASGGRYG